MKFLDLYGRSKYLKLTKKMKKKHTNKQTKKQKIRKIFKRKRNKSHENHIVFISNYLPCLNLIALFLFLDMNNVITSLV